MLDVPAEVDEARLGLTPHDLAATVGATAAGLALLLVRPLLVGRASAGIGFAAIYLAIWVVSLAQPIPSNGARRLHPAVALAVGVLAVVVATRAPGPRIPIPVGPEALVLNTLAAVSEEAFFRRFLFGRLAVLGGAAAVGCSALAFALVHLPAYGVAALWVDLGAGLLLSWQRWASGGWTAPAVTHAAANLLVVMG